MRAIVMLFLLIAAPCFAEDPLESLNTVEDTLNTMKQSLSAQPLEHGDSKAVRTAFRVAEASEAISAEQELNFVSNEALGVRGWVKAKPCSEEVAFSKPKTGPESCAEAAEDVAAPETFYWKSRAALPADWKGGVLVVAQDKGDGGEWYVAQITDASQAAAGKITLSAPIEAHLKTLRVVEE
jgi:hypothetical protein